MNKRAAVIGLLDEIDYIDAHIHTGAGFLGEVCDNILYFANAVDEESYLEVLELAKNSRFIIPTFGIHPMRAFEADITPERLEELISQNDFVGEIGIDYFWMKDRKTYPKQREIFERQLRIIGEYDKIPSIHTKGAETEILDLLTRCGIRNAIIHWYSGPVGLIDRYLETGCYFTIGPDIFADSEVYKRIPVERMLAETDNPTGMPWILGGEPSGDDVIKVYKELSSKLGTAEKELVERMKRNLRNLMEA